MAIRLHTIVEGQTEEAFVKNVLGPHLEGFSVWVNARSVTTKRERGIKYRGGVVNYRHSRDDIIQWVSEDRNSDARFTTMFDLYALPRDFPGYATAARASSPYERVRILEGFLRDDISDWRFVPYIQLHEFEALLLCDPQQLAAMYGNYGPSIERLIAMSSQFSSPELINDGQDTAPSKRIISAIPRYRKAIAGTIVAERIGLPALRSKCLHFDEWGTQLEAFS